MQDQLNEAKAAAFKLQLRLNYAEGAKNELARKVDFMNDDLQNQDLEIKQKANLICSLEEQLCRLQQSQNATEAKYGVLLAEYQQSQESVQKLKNRLSDRDLAIAELNSQTRQTNLQIQDLLGQLKDQKASHEAQRLEMKQMYQKTQNAHANDLLAQIQQQQELNFKLKDDCNQMQLTQQRHLGQIQQLQMQVRDKEQLAQQLAEQHKESLGEKERQVSELKRQIVDANQFSQCEDRESTQLFPTSQQSTKDQGQNQVELQRKYNQLKATCKKQQRMNDELQNHNSFLVSENSRL